MNKQKQAFTLVELIVVITILAILWTIAFISLQWYSKDARDWVRISDVSNMKTALELFHLDAGKYPLPDSGETVVYSWAIVWTQWEFWDTVVSNLSRSLNKAPTDPLSDKKYVYSVSWNRNNFEILNLIEWEWDIALWNISQTNAVTTTRIAKVEWIYNWLYVKTGNYIVVTPSLITALEYTTWDDISSEILSSMVVEWYDNVPDAWNATTQTWAISWIVLSATWIINKDSTDAEKISVMKTIQNAYTWSDLATWNLYDFILSKTSDADILALSESIVIGNSNTTTSSTPTPVVATNKFTNSVLLTVDQWDQLNTWYWDSNKVWTLCYRASQDWTAWSTFHTNCDGLWPTISIYKFWTYIVWWYAWVSWASTGPFISNADSWLFNLNTSSKTIVTSSANALYASSADYLPSFWGWFDLTCYTWLVSCSAVNHSYNPNPIAWYTTASADDLEVYY
jgi:prepilin-type N-terminal cleavage/methylation domain-containing protein